MAWTYSDPSTDNRQAVRFYIGDTNTNDQQFSDAEIDFLLTKRSDPLMAAADGCRRLAAKYARQADTSNLSLSISASQRSVAYTALAKELEANAASLTGAEIHVGGQSINEKETLSEDTDAVQPAFSVGMDNYPGSDGSTDTE